MKEICDNEHAEKHLFYAQRYYKQASLSDNPVLDTAEYAHLSLIITRAEFEKEIGHPEESDRIIKAGLEGLKEGVSIPAKSELLVKCLRNLGAKNK